MINIIKDFIEFRKKKEQQRICCKRFVILQTMIKYFEDLQRAGKTVELPPCISALNEVNKLDTNRKINRMYRKLELAGLV